MLSTVCLGWPPMRRCEKLAPFRRWLGLDLALPCHVYRSRFFARGAIARSTVRYLNRPPPHGVKTRVALVLPSILTFPLFTHLRTALTLFSSAHQSPSLSSSHIHIFTMPVVRHSISHDDTLYHARAEAVGKKYTTAQIPRGSKPRYYSRQTLKDDRPLPRRRNYILKDTRGVPDSEITPLLWVDNPDIA